MDVFSTLVAFLVGTATGAAGKYFADKYTDQRKSKEDAANLHRTFSRLRDLMPELVREMKTDLAKEQAALVREFVILPNESVIFQSSKPRFCYFENRHADLRNKVSLLVDAGFATDVSPGNAPIYRMADHFVHLLKSE